MVSLELEARLDNLLATAQAETANVDLFAPMAEGEECPICMIPILINREESSFMTCCGKQICNGCTFKKLLKELENGVPKDWISKQKCAFCRESTPDNANKALEKLMKRNCPHAFMSMAEKYNKGEYVFQSDTKSLEMYIRAAELGDAEAFEEIAEHYRMGKVVERDVSKAMEFYEVAAKEGSMNAHKYLSSFHSKNGNIDVSIRHCKVVACAGDKEAIDIMMEYYKTKQLSKEELTQTLRAYQASKDGTKSKDRDDARVALMPKV